MAKQSKREYSRQEAQAIIHAYDNAGDDLQTQAVEVRKVIYAPPSDDVTKAIVASKIQQLKQLESMPTVDLAKISDICNSIDKELRELRRRVHEPLVGIPFEHLKHDERHVVLEAATEIDSGPWLTRGGHMALTGKGGIGKSLLVIQILYSMARGYTTAANIRLNSGKKPDDGLPVVIFGTGEDDEEECHKRAWRIIEKDPRNPNNEWPANLVFVKLKGPFFAVPEDDKHAPAEVTISYDYLWDLIADLKPLIIAVDPLMHVFQGEENSTSSARAYLAAMDYIAEATNTAMLTIMHPNKAARSAGTDKNDPGQVAGAAGWHDGMRSVVLLTKPDARADKDFHEEKRRRELSVMKNNRGAANIECDLLARHEMVSVNDGEKEVMGHIIDFYADPDHTEWWEEGEKRHAEAKAKEEAKTEAKPKGKAGIESVSVKDLDADEKKEIDEWETLKNEAGGNV